MVVYRVGSIILWGYLVAIKRGMCLSVKVIAIQSVSPIKVTLTQSAVMISSSTMTLSNSNLPALRTSLHHME